MKMITKPKFYNKYKDGYSFHTVIKSIFIPSCYHLYNYALLVICFGLRSKNKGLNYTKLNKV